MSVNGLFTRCCFETLKYLRRPVKRQCRIVAWSWSCKWSDAFARRLVDSSIRYSVYRGYISKLDNLDVNFLQFIARPVQIGIATCNVFNVVRSYKYKYTITSIDVLQLVHGVFRT